MPYGLNKRVSLKDSIAITFLAITDFIALGYEVCRKSNSPHLMEIPFGQTKSYLEKLTERKLRKNTTYYKLKKKKVFELHSNKIKIDLDSPWWKEFLNYRFRFFQAPYKWDKKWTVVTYDIPEKKSLLRNRFRRVLNKLGFKNWQRSVWVSINPVTHLLKDLIATWELEKFVTAFGAKNIFRDQDNEMIDELFSPKEIEQRYQDFIVQANQALKLENKRGIRLLLDDFPYLVLNDSGLPAEFFEDVEIRVSLLNKYKQILKNYSKAG